MRDSAKVRWSVVALVSFTMLCGYIITDVMAPLKTMIEQDLGWSSYDYGLFTSGYRWLNVVVFMLIISGIVLDKMGVRFTGVSATIVMIAGAGIKYWALSTVFDNPMATLSIGSWEIFSIKRQVLYAALGFSVFGVGVEAICITATKAIVRWFKGKETALALGLNVATARIGTILAMSVSPVIAEKFSSPSMPLLFCLLMLVVGLMSFLVFCVLDRRLDSEEVAEREASGEEFRLRDIVGIVKIRSFWYIAALCVLFYSAVFPFLKYASDLMVQKFGVDSQLAGTIPSLLPLGTLFLTPLFGSIYDRKGRGATIMIIGSLMLIAIHLLFSVPALNNWVIAVILMVLLGVAFSMVPSAMWPSVPKIIDERRLGTAYSLVFWIQNWGLMGVPLLIGYILDRPCCKVGMELVGGTEVPVYDYTVPMLVFATFGLLGLVFALLLKADDKKMGYGLEEPNIE